MMAPVHIAILSEHLPSFVKPGSQMLHMCSIFLTEKLQKKCDRVRSEMFCHETFPGKRVPYAARSKRGAVEGRGIKTSEPSNHSRPPAGQYGSPARSAGFDGMLLRGGEQAGKSMSRPVILDHVARCIKVLYFNSFTLVRRFRVGIVWAKSVTACPFSSANTARNVLVCLATRNGRPEPVPQQK